VQKAWGHLVIARECVASALASRIDAGDFDQPEALRLAKLWLHDNPARIYRLPTTPESAPEPASPKTIAQLLSKECPLPIRRDEAKQVMLGLARGWGGNENWAATSKMRIYSRMADEARANRSLESFGWIHDELKAHWQVFRGRPSGTWSRKRIAEEIVALPDALRTRRLSTVTEPEWASVWECVARLRDLKPNESGPSVMAISKFLHFWNPRLFVIVDRRFMENDALRIPWVAEGIRETRLPPSVPVGPGRGDDRLADYIRILKWASDFLTRNPDVVRAFTDVVAEIARGAPVPDDIGSYEATAIELFLVALADARSHERS
jgi:hypothetical protein